MDNLEFAFKLSRKLKQYEKLPAVNELVNQRQLRWFRVIKITF
jgi:hypothetical protein